ncbi:hypothetical protein BaRGS_00020865 [Batillaria attramentaria]|uniref:Tyrosine-protein phosphatase domain-containing protein n=1 Tax=Batillaria attramentaria TaxID=370345 RepID=A0ABD0KLC3_9CAEN
MNTSPRTHGTHTHGGPLASENIQLMDPTTLYNLLQETSVHCARLSDPNFLLLCDARERASYDENHILTAISVQKHIVVYDGKTDSLKDSTAPVVQWAHFFWDMGSMKKVNVLKGGFEEFSRQYPFLRTTKELDDLKLYPPEIVPGLLYIGNWCHGNDPQIHQDLHIKAHVCVSKEDETFMPGKNENKLQIKIQDSNNIPLTKYFSKSATFIEKRIGKKIKQKEPVLVFDKTGISLAPTIAMAYLIKAKKADLETVWTQVKKCMPNARPNRGFVQQLALWEEATLGARSTDIAEPFY